MLINLAFSGCETPQAPVIDNIRASLKIRIWDNAGIGPKATLIGVCKRKGSGMNIYLGNLSDTTTEETLTSLFAPFGTIESLKVIKDKFSGRSKGFGFIEMPSNSEADKAIKALNGSPLDGKLIKVRPADSGGKRQKKRSFRRRDY